MKRIATGYAVHSIDLFDLFPPKLISLKKKDFQALGINKKKKRVAERVFTCMYKMMLEDIVNNNDIFIFPIDGHSIHMKKKPDDVVTKICDTHGFGDFNILKSGYTRYEISYDVFLKRRRKINSTPIYVGNALKNIINRKTYKLEY